MRTSSHRKLLVVLALWLVCPVAYGQRFVLDSAHSSVHFSVAHFDRSWVRGRWMNLVGSADYDPIKKTGAVALTIDPDTVDTGLRVLDNVLKSAQFFDTEQFGSVGFKSTDFDFDGERLNAVNGVLSLHGVSLPVRLLAERFSCGEIKIMALRKYVCGGNFSVTIRRSDFGMTRFLPDVGDEVRIDISVEASPGN